MRSFIARNVLALAIVAKCALSANIPSDVGDETTTDDKHRLLSVDTELVERLDKREESVNALCLLTNHGLVHDKLNLVMIEVLLHLLAVDIENIHVHHCETSSPSLVAFSKITLAWFEDIVNEREVVLNLLVTLYVEALGRLRHGSLQVRHVSSVEEGKILRGRRIEEALLVANRALFIKSLSSLFCSCRAISAGFDQQAAMQSTGSKSSRPKPNQHMWGEAVAIP